MKNDELPIFSLDLPGEEFNHDHLITRAELDCSIVLPGSWPQRFPQNILGKKSSFPHLKVGNLISWVEFQWWSFSSGVLTGNDGKTKKARKTEKLGTCDFLTFSTSNLWKNHKWEAEMRDWDAVPVWRFFPNWDPGIDAVSSWQVNCLYIFYACLDNNLERKDLCGLPCCGCPVHQLHFTENHLKSFFIWKDQV